MIAIESFKKFRIIDLVVIFLLSVLYFLLSFLINNLSPQISYIFSLLVLIILMSFGVHLIRKAGSATLFFLIVGILTFNIDDLGVVGMNKLVTMIIAGIIFELIFLILKLEFKNIQLDIIIGSGISAASIPLISGMLLSFIVMLNMFVSIINLMILSFLVGIAGGIISFLLWYYLRTSKFIMRFEYMQ